jgi:hypothetical protein
MILDVAATTSAPCCRRPCFPGKSALRSSARLSIVYLHEFRSENIALVWLLLNTITM